jgi:hypothetical protein
MSTSLPRPLFDKSSSSDTILRVVYCFVLPQLAMAAATDSIKGRTEHEYRSLMTQPILFLHALFTRFFVSSRIFYPFFSRDQVFVEFS